ncbi:MULTISPECIES: dihydroxyacetone kinase subunit DhaL [unclassified Halorubrum]|uniref:dihydroxyacetone kinase subunit DhaL n=1 Tax=unclassified Halorubrum TaxID=2642239 RepID=UPI000B98A388|nr:MULTISPECIES: dihydroxyacetone kinase subunit DhaL [unclassified Halorubrum]OYR43272.1 dihydroxyacetone kinase subunit L [Halorubrum sp. Hd13]OYR48933.1 dihydroxyacetone kinase subunit L [Halorubrum sp. Ea1]OYR52031.1 dihydroxyacetone kinase subunit L [Halorubrum sp. Ea8]
MSREGRTDGGTADEATEGAAVVAAVEAVADRIEDERDHLTELDSAIGDADHGGNMARGWAAAADAARDLDDPDPQSVCRTVGKTLMAEVGGASGPLFGGSFVFASAELDDGVTAESAVAFAETYLQKVEDRGDARVGDQTVVDALTPAVHTFKKSIETDELPPLEALAKAVDAAERGVAFTVPIRAKKGRASYLGWRSVGHQDPGATSALYILEELLATAADALDSEVPDADATSPTIPDEEPDDAAGDGEGDAPPEDGD